MRRRFVQKVFEKLLETEQMNLSDEMLVVAGGTAERDLLRDCGFDHVTITNLDSVEASSY